MQGFQLDMLVLGGLLVCGALISGVTHRSFLSLTALYVVAGIVLGDSGFEVLDFSPQDPFVEDLAVVALVLILFRDGLEVDAEMLQREWRAPLRKLLLAMPITAAIIAVAAHAIVGLDWLEAFLLGALLSPTDPVLSQSVVTNPLVPRRVRHSLNLESGLNDGLALAPVIALSAALSTTGDDFVWWRFIFEDISIGLAAGVATGLLAAALLPREDQLREIIPPHQRVLFAIGIVFASYGALSYGGHGNAFIDVFVCAITLGIRRPDLRHHVDEGTKEITEIVKLGIFVVFGSIVSFGGMLDHGTGAVAILVIALLVARPIAIWVALVGVRPPFDTQTKAFMAWFGPKGVATMTYSLFVLGEHVSGGQEIFDLAALVVLGSILLHGLTDHPGSAWMGRHAQRTGAV